MAAFQNFVSVELLFKRSSFPRACIYELCFCFALEFDGLCFRWNYKIVDYKKWRKSSQFIALKRSHAIIAVGDKELRPKFQQYCFTDWEPIRHLCVADEHYFPTLLAFHNLDNQVKPLSERHSLHSLLDGLSRLCHQLRMGALERSVASHFLRCRFHPPFPLQSVCFRVSSISESSFKDWQRKEKRTKNVSSTKHVYRPRRSTAAFLIHLASIAA